MFQISGLVESKDSLTLVTLVHQVALGLCLWISLLRGARALAIDASFDDLTLLSLTLCLKSERELQLHLSRASVHTRVSKGADSSLHTTYNGKKLLPCFQFNQFGHSSKHPGALQTPTKRWKSAVPTGAKHIKENGINSPSNAKNMLTIQILWNQFTPFELQAGWRFKTFIACFFCLR